MGALTEIYVDPAIAADSGAGTIGDPYGDLQYALNTVTRDATNGDRFNIKAGTAEVLSSAVTFATYGSPTTTAPVAFEGYTAAAGDGGVGEISGGDANITLFPNTSNMIFKSLKLGNCGTNSVLIISTNCLVLDCEVHSADGNGVWAGATNIVIVNNYFHDIGGYGVNGSSNMFVLNNYFLDGASRKFDRAIYIAGGVAYGNIVSLNDTGGIGIYCNGAYCLIQNNSVFNAAAGTLYGILFASDFAITSACINNLVEGWSGAGGIGFYATSDTRLYRGNAAYNNTTNFDETDVNIDSDNESLTASPFAKVGENTFANRSSYFAPVNIGLAWQGTYLSGMLRGAVHPKLRAGPSLSLGV